MSRSDPWRDSLLGFPHHVTDGVQSNSETVAETDIFRLFFPQSTLAFYEKVLELVVSQRMFVEDKEQHTKHRNSLLYTSVFMFIYIYAFGNSFYTKWPTMVLSGDQTHDLHYLHLVKSQLIGIRFYMIFTKVMHLLFAKNSTALLVM